MKNLDAILAQTGHRPWPPPDRPWQGYMRWTDLAFLHWPVPEAAVRPYVPRGLEIDTFEGDAWLGIVPFRMEGVRHRWLPPVPTAANFLEINVRTYVVGNGRGGVWFFSLDAGSRLAVRGARALFNLPYHHARMTAPRDGRAIVYDSRRVGRTGSAASFVARYRPTGPVYRAESGGLDHWLTERYCLFGQNRAGRLYHLDIHHPPWPLQRAEALIDGNSLSLLLDDREARAAPLCHFAQRLDVIGWPRSWFPKDLRTAPPPP